MTRHIDGIMSCLVHTPRGRVHLLEAGEADAMPVLFVHGNVSAATFWEEVMVALSSRYRALVPDLRGYGTSDQHPVDATRGVRDFSDDLHSLLQTLNIGDVHVVGNSMGGNVVMQYAIDHSDYVRSLTLVAPGSPYGFGGTKDARGTPCWPDYAGSGGGIVNQEIINRLQAGDTGMDSRFSPRSLLRNHYVKPPFVSPREDVLVEAMLQTATTIDAYSRDMIPSPNWPGVAPGTRGVNNALSPKYCNQSSLAHIHPKPPICWIRGLDDQIVSDASLSDMGNLGALGFLPNWPGADVFPPQPMLQQMRDVLKSYKAQGGSYHEHVMANVGHVPYLEDRHTFLGLWLPFLQAW